MITRESIDRLYDSIDIVDLVANYIDVRKVGANYMALCPFHDDRVASMSLSRVKGLYYCHACGASGNAIKFVMEYERLDFSHAVEHLARFFNVPLEYSKEWVKKSDILESLSNFYHHRIFSAPDILSYLNSRGIDRDDIEMFQIGYSDSSFETLKFIDENHLSKDDAKLYGMIDDRHYAKFTYRIMFPIHSANGMIVGFGGRSLNPENPAKYINSTQSRIFNKSKILYGYNLAKRHIYKSHSMIVCEGYLDVVMLHKVGFKNAVATLGTSINESHLYLLSRDNPKVLMCYDGDSAGIKAALRAARFLSRHGIDGAVILLENGLDPADMVHQGLIDKFQDKLDNATSFPIFVLQSIIKTCDFKNPMDLQRVIKECSEYLNTLSETLRLEYRRVCANMLGVHERQIEVRGETKKIGFNIEQTSDIEMQREKNILFNMLSNARHKELGVNYLRAEYFRFFESEFRAILDNQEPQGLVDELKSARFQSSSEAVFLQDLRRFITLRLDDINSKILVSPNLSPEDRQKVRFYLLQVITALRKGELMRVEMDLSWV